MESIQERLVVFREHTSLNKKAFADKIGMNSGLYGRYESGENKPSFETLEKIAASFPKLSLNWLLTGKGGMLLDKPSAPEPSPTQILQAESETLLKLAVTEEKLKSAQEQLEAKTQENGRLWEMLGKPLSSLEAALARLLVSGREVSTGLAA